MKKANRFITALVAMAALLSSCDSSEKITSTPQENRGGISLSAKTIRTISGVGTKAMVEDPYIVSNDQLMITITAQSGGKTFTWNNLNQVPEVVYLDEGTHDITVRSNYELERFNNKPYYSGTLTITVVNNKVISIDIPIYIRNQVVTVQMQEGVAPLDNYQIDFFDLRNPQESLYNVTQAQNSPNPARVYMIPGDYGVRIEGELHASRWSKNILITDDLGEGVYHNIIVK